MSFWIAGAIVVGSIATAGTAAYNAKKQRKATRKATEKNEALAAKADADAKADKERTAMTLAMKGQARRRRAAKGPGRSDIMTGSLGLTGSATGGGGKKLLGN